MARRGRWASAAALAVAAIACAMVSPWLAAAESPRSEYEVKAAFLLNFASLVEWPVAALGDAGEPLVLGVLGEEEVDETIERGIQGRTVDHRPVRVVRLSGTEQLESCHIVFVSAAKRALNGEVIAASRGHNVLTIGETRDFASQGGIINFFRQGKKIRFEVNREAAERAQLRVSSRLLRLAKIVSGGS
jgi:hypothetical protein